MKIVSWNINGIRSLKKDISVIIAELDADIACFQECKITRELMTEKLALVTGFRSYFSYSRVRAGYSGVATYCKRELQPVDATNSLLSRLDSEDKEPVFSLPNDVLKALDCEGRTLITQHRLQDAVEGKSLLTILNLYCPCVSGEKEGRELFRLQFLQTLEERIRQLQEISHVVVLGDINISHRVIDSCDPGEEAGFLAQPHRQWLDRLLCQVMGPKQEKGIEEGPTQEKGIEEGPTQEKGIDEGPTQEKGIEEGPKQDKGPEEQPKLEKGPKLDKGPKLGKGLTLEEAPKQEDIEMGAVWGDGLLIDTFRALHPNQKFAYTCWDTKTNSRQTNFGTRIDYILLDKALQDYLCSADVLAKYLGSDHCPVRAELTNLNVQPSPTPPSLCSSHRFKVKQQKLTMFLSKGKASKNPFDVFDSVPKSEICPSKSDKKKRKTNNPPATLKGFVKRSKSNVGANSSISSADLAGSQTSIASGQSDNETQSQSPSSLSCDSETRAAGWSKVFTKKSQAVPVCSGHREECVLQTVKKKGDNKGRRFYSCGRAAGLPRDTQARCSYFKWADEI